MWVFFSVCLVLVVTTIGLLLRHFAGPTVPCVVQAATAYAWLTSLSICVLVPLDVWSTLAKQPNDAIDVMWDFCYWSTQALTWLLLPFFQVYADAGDFTVGARCLTSLRENGILFGLAGAAGALGLVLLLLLQRGLHLSDVMALGMALSNTFGLCAGILLMGYGLVELPRGMWRSSDPEQSLKWCCHRAGRFAEAVLKATTELEAVVTIICANERQMPRRDPLRPYMDIISQTAESESPVKPSAIAARQFDIEQLTADDLEYNYDKAGLAALRRRLNAAMHGYRGAHAQYAQVIMQAQELEDMVKCRQLGEYVAPGGASGWRALLWRWRCIAQPLALKAGAAVLMGTSLLVVWCEGTIFTGRNPDLSPFSLAIRRTQGADWGVQMLTLLPLAYICVCTCFALFRLNAFNYNKLLSHATTGTALMQNGSLMCRFAAPTCWNFLHMIRMDGNVDGEVTVFTQNMGTMTVLPVLGRHLNVYLPLLLVLHVALIALNLWDRLAAACISPKYRFSSDDVDDEYTERGRLLIRKEAEAVANGMRVGDILHSGVSDDLFPGAGPKRSSGSTSSAKRLMRGLLAGLGGRKPGASGGGGSSGSSAAVAVDGGTRGERAPLFSGPRSGGVEGGGAAGVRGSLLASLVKNKHSHSPQASDSEATEAAAAGLDGLFAELTTKPSTARRTTG